MKLYLHIDNNYNKASCIRVLNQRLLPRVIWLNGAAFNTPELRAYFSRHSYVHGLKPIIQSELYNYKPTNIWVFSDFGRELQQIAVEIGATFEHFTIETVDFKCSK